MFRLNNIKQNILIVAIAASLTGCGGGGSTDSTPIDSTTTINLKPVTVSADTIDVTENSATIDLTAWLDMDYTVTQVKYDYVTNNNYGLTISINDTESTVTLVNLKSNTTYHYQIIGVDNNGKRITNKENLIFTTLAVTTQPIITDPTPTQPIVTDPIVTDPIVTDPIVTEPTPVETNNPPEAQNVKIVGTPKVGETLTLDYTFIDIDRDPEGNSIIAWSTPTVEVQRGTSKTFTIPAELAGEEISAWIHPSDGTVVTTSAVQAANGYLLIEDINTPITEPNVTDPTPTPTSPSTGTAKTNWGFQAFTIPNNSVTIQAGDDIQNAIDSLPNGGTVQLSEGTYYANRVHVRSNIVLQGAGPGKTIIKFRASSPDAYLINVSGSSTETQNAIIRNMTVDATGNGNANGVEITYGANNVLVENIEVFGAGKSNLLVWNPDGQESRHVTFRNVISHHAGMHGLSMRIVRGAIIDNCEAYNTKGYGWDLSTSTYAEISNNYAHDNDMGSKYPGSTYVYLHDNRLENNGLVGMKFNKLTGSEQYWHIENNSIINCAAGAVDWGDTYSIPTMQELVVRGNTLIGNSSNKIRIRGIIETYEYNDNVGIVEARAGTVEPVQIPSGSTPAEDYVGYTSWPAYN